MPAKPAPEIQTVGVIGAGLMGSGWAARFLAHGLDVIALVPDPGAEAHMRASIARAWPALENLGLMPGASRDRLRFATDLARLCRRVDFIQLTQTENFFEPPQRWETLAAASSPGAIIATDSALSSDKPNSQGSESASRVLMARAVAPVYLLPLVEVAGYPETAEAALEEAMAFYRWVGMHPVRVSKPTQESAAERLWTALQQEANGLINEGSLVTENVDDLIVYGPGLRWAIQGAFSPTLEAGQAEASLDDSLDEAIVGVMRSLRPQNLASGRIIDFIETKRYTSRRLRRWQPGTPIARPLELLQMTADPSWIDYNGHMTEASYLTAFGDASDALFRYVGIDEAYRAAGLSFYTVETHINYYREVGAGVPLQFMTQLLGLDKKRLHIFHRMVDAGTATQVATTEQMLVHVDMKAARASPIRPDVFEALQAIQEAHQDMPTPAQVGRQMKLKGG